MTFLGFIILISIADVYSIVIPHRIPTNYDSISDDCRSGLCAGAGEYPANSDILYYAEFDIPPLPSSFNENQQTYYIYFNIFFKNALNGKYNQFVPQLMLGATLNNSTNYPDYKPLFSPLNSWYIGSQYFFATTIDSKETDYAATGELIPVNEGDIVYTEFYYNDTSTSWILNMGIKGTNKISTVIATQPYMGKLNTTSSWNEDTYNTTFVGSCCELQYITNIPTTNKDIIFFQQIS